MKKIIFSGLLFFTCALFVYDTYTKDYPPTIIKATEIALKEYYLKSPSSYKFIDAHFSLNNNGNPEMLITYESKNSFGVNIKSHTIIPLKRAALMDNSFESSRRNFDALGVRIKKNKEDDIDNSYYTDRDLGSFLFEYIEPASSTDKSTADNDKFFYITISNAFNDLIEKGYYITVNKGKIINVENNKAILDKVLYQYKYEDVSLYGKILLRIKLFFGI